MISGHGEDIDDAVDLKPPSGGSPPLQSKVTHCPRNSWPDSGQWSFLEITICSLGRFAALDVSVIGDYILSRLRTALSLTMLTLSQTLSTPVGTAKRKSPKLSSRHWLPIHVARRFRGCISDHREEGTRGVVPPPMSFEEHMIYNRRSQTRMRRRGKGVSDKYI